MGKSENTGSNPDSTQDKRAEVLGKAKGAAKGRKYLVFLIAVAMAVVGWALTRVAPERPAATGQEVTVTQTADAVIHNVADFNDGKARHFMLKTPDGIEVRYFVLKSSDGVIRAAFDACDVCWRANKGYSQDGDVMVCNNCGRRFPSVSVNEVQGGCNPAPLKRAIDGDKLIIVKADIYAGARFFTF